MRDLRLLPKAHLHLHLEAGMRPGTLSELAAQKGLQVPEVGAYGDFSAFSAVYDLATRVLCTRADWERLAEEMMVDAAAEGCVYLEPAFWAARYRDTLGEDRDVWAVVLEIFGAAAARHRIGIGFIVAVDRVHDSPADAQRTAELAVTLKPWGVVGLGLHNDEIGHPPGDFAQAFAIARAGGLRSVPHAGELDCGQTVRDAVDLLGAVRVAHGVRAGEVPGLLERLAADGICLDVCPTSNRVLGVVPDTAGHPLRELLAAGVRCTLNADDPLLFSTTLLGEYEVARTVIGLDDATLARIARVSVEESRLPVGARHAALAGIVRWLTEDETALPVPLAG
ncbi:adenosine deaminase [Nakamurella flavida]|uniref:Adenosine deaminase n=1 Tax=Nakamurella flavida TaxID=363630 RepID=A0A938YIE7_9ACTN|nr:adenosine deaminase [Nakamurella flavida]MBM9475689.1 adenosine deaminase [Nakamurella flavida]MDP9778034.1 adenosine deaminase [Nakamurella flavida]